MILFPQLLTELVNRGHTVDIACSQPQGVPDSIRELGSRIYTISVSRNPLYPGNIKAIGQIKKIVSQGEYDLVHCHTPIASACTRLACRKLRKSGLKVYYTSHGFHFYRGAPLLNWLIFYPIEKVCARFTDLMLTINHEDYYRAQKKLKARRIEYVPGAGVDTERFTDVKVDRKKKRAELNVPEDAFVLISVGEINQNKNHQIIIRALAQLNRPDIHYIIAGTGPLEAYLKHLAEESGVGDRVHLLGFRHDVPELICASDVNVFPTIREGLGIAALEGMAAGLPLICADNRGTREYAKGYCTEDFQGVCRDRKQFETAIARLADDRELYEQLSKTGPVVAEKFSIKNVNRIMVEKIYRA